MVDELNNLVVGQDVLLVALGQHKVDGLEHATQGLAVVFLNGGQCLVDHLADGLLDVHQATELLAILQGDGLEELPASPLGDPERVMGTALVVELGFDNLLGGTTRPEFFDERGLVSGKLV